MKIVFFGTPEFAVPSLKILLSNGYNIVGVVTAPDKKAGRGLKVKMPPVKEVAVAEGLKVLQPVKLSDPEFIRDLESAAADLFIVVAFRMLPEAVWKMPPLGTFNLHSSLLPDYRGAAPINRAVMNGETVTGVTTFFLKQEIDTGNILFRKETDIGNEETAGELHDRLKIIGAELLLSTVQAIEKGTIRPVEQANMIDDETILKTAPKIFSSDCEINWDRPATQVHNQIRGLSPFPGAFTILHNNSGKRLLLKLYRSAITDLNSEMKPGSLLIRDRKMYISCADKMLEIVELQQEGKRKIRADEFIRGFRNESLWTWQSNN